MPCQDVEVLLLTSLGLNLEDIDPTFASDIQAAQTKLTRSTPYPNPATSSLHGVGSPHVPSNIRFLLSHYVNHVIDSLSGLPQSQAPWKTIHVPYAMTAYGELDIMGQSSFARVSLLYSVLSLTCYHLGTLYGPSSDDGSAGVGVQVSDVQAASSQYWNSQGAKLREIARTAFRKCLHAISAQQTEPVKYKEVFVSAMSLICAGVRLVSTRLLV